MKFRHRKQDIPDADEAREVERLRDLLREKQFNGHVPPPDTYWSNLLVRTNRRLDEASSGVALSISWAARVAIPGVVAIIFFFIGLHYYVPDQPAERTTLTTVVLSLPEATIDTLLQDPLLGAPLAVTGLQPGLFELSGATVTDYLIEQGKTETLLETMTDRQVDDLLLVLGRVN